MKTSKSIAIGICGLLFILSVWIGSNQNPNAATLSKGTTFTTNQTVQYYDLNNLVDQATISGIISSEITDGTITQGDMGNNSIGTAQIIEGTIATGDIASRTILGSNIATNEVTGIELNTNLVFRSGTHFYTNVNTFLTFTNSTLLFSTNQIGNGAVAGTTNTVGAASAGKVVKLNDSGTLSPQFTPFSQAFVSADQTITFGGSLTVAHGLSGAPTLILARLKNTSTEANYTANDELIIALGGLDAATSNGISLVPDATNLNIRFGAAINVPDKTTGTATSITAAKWVLIIYAWR